MALSRSALMVIGRPPPFEWVRRGSRAGWWSRSRLLRAVDLGRAVGIRSRVVPAVRPVGIGGVGPREWRQELGVGCGGLFRCRCPALEGGLRDDLPVVEHRPMPDAAELAAPHG